jgi:hypothetical protein
MPPGKPGGVTRGVTTVVPVYALVPLMAVGGIFWRASGRGGVAASGAASAV